MIQIIPIIPHPFFVIPITIIIPILQLPWFSQAESPIDLPDNVPSLSRGRGSARHLLLFNSTRATMAQVMAVAYVFLRCQKGLPSPGVSQRLFLCFFMIISGY